MCAKEQVKEKSEQAAQTISIKLMVRKKTPGVAQRCVASLQSIEIWTVDRSAFRSNKLSSGVQL